MLDLETSNSAGSDNDPVWYKLYSARYHHHTFLESSIIFLCRQDLELNGLEPQDWETMLKRLVNDEEFYQKVVVRKLMKYFYIFCCSGGTISRRQDLVTMRLTTRERFSVIC